MRPFVLAILLVSLAVPAGVPRQTPATPAPVPDPGAGYYFLLGRHLESEGKIDEAIAAHRKAVGLEPRSAELHAEIAGLFARQNRPIEALEAAQAALERDADNREANRILGSIYAAISDQRQPLRAGEDPASYRGQAIVALEKARRGPFDVNVELMLGRLHIQAGEHAKAIPPLRRVVDDQPGYPEAAMLLAGAYDETGQPAEAVRVLEATNAGNQTFFRGRVRLAELYEQERRFRDAAAMYAAAQAINPKTDLTGPRATALINAGDAPAAREILQAAIKAKAAPDGTLLFLLAQAHRRAGDRAAAAAAIEQLREAFPSDLRAVLLDAQVSQDDGRYDDAIDAFKTLMAKLPDDPTFVYQYANLLEKRGRVAEAERALRDLLARDPLDAGALNSLGYMFAERGERLDEAVELLQRALAIEPENPSFLDSLGWAYFRQGRVELAEEPLARAASALPQSSTVQDHLGDLRFKQQRFKDAVVAWERALAGDGLDIDRAAVEKKLGDARAQVKR